VRSAEGYLTAVVVSQSVAAPEVGVSNIENKAAGPAVGVTEVNIDVAEKVDDSVAEADSNAGRGKSESDS